MLNLGAYNCGSLCLLILYLHIISIFFSRPQKMKLNDVNQCSIGLRSILFPVDLVLVTTIVLYSEFQLYSCFTDSTLSVNSLWLCVFFLANQMFSCNCASLFAVACFSVSWISATELESRSYLLGESFRVHS